MSTAIKHTYGSRSKRPRLPLLPSSSRSSDSPFKNGPDDESDGERPQKKLRTSGSAIPSIYSSLIPSSSMIAKKKENVPANRSKSTSTRKSLAKTTSAPALTQLHLAFSSTSMKTCKLCSLSYSCGALEDERLHKAHCQRVTRGMEWGRDEEKARGIQVIEEGVRLEGSPAGRIIEVRADSKGKIGSKLSTLFETINLSLSSPPLPAETLAHSKAYIFLLPGKTAAREKIVGCVIATRITHAMQIVDTQTSSSEKKGLVWVDGEEGGIYCDPSPLLTPMGIPRLFVSSDYRRKGIAGKLLSAAAKNFIHGCELDPKRGEVAFSQPTGAGRGTMFAWGRGGVRIFQE